MRGPMCRGSDNLTVPAFRRSRGTCLGTIAMPGMRFDARIPGRDAMLYLRRVALFGCPIRSWCRIPQIPPAGWSYRRALQELRIGGVHGPGRMGPQARSGREESAEWIATCARQRTTSARKGQVLYVVQSPVGVSRGGRGKSKERLTKTAVYVVCSNSS
jgi:hypothetical protein